MTKLTFLPDHRTVPAELGGTILAAAQANGIPLQHICGGQTRCLTCQVEVLEGAEHLGPRNEKERRLAAQHALNDGTRLACQTEVQGPAKLRRLVIHEQDLVNLTPAVVERVRAEVLAMRSANDFIRIAALLWEGLRDLGLSLDFCSIDVFGERCGPSKTYGVGKRELRDRLELELNCEDIFPGVDCFFGHTPQVCNSGAQLDQLRWQDGPTPQEMAVPFSQGRIAIHRFDGGPFQPKDERVLERFAEAVSLAYARHADMELLEAKHLALQQTQTELVQTASMASLGRLVAGVAHELNSPLGALKSSIQTLERALERASTDATPELSKTLQNLRSIATLGTQATGRIDSVVTKLRRFARLDQSERDVVDVHGCLEDAISMLELGKPATARIERKFSELPKIECYPAQLNQVFVNLIQNAYENMEGPGTVCIETSTGADRIKIRIADSGRGISEDIQDRIFEPGFTTKGSGVGTGLGLSIVMNIMRAHGGQIELLNGDQPGAAFELTLPLKSPV